MTQIGSFSKVADGYAGTIRTMTINVKAKIVANDKNGNDKAPDFRILGCGGEIGAAWRATPKDENKKPFLRVELDDPSFAEPLRAALFDDAGGESANLVWQR